jgi:hypothetical protein
MAAINPTDGEYRELGRFVYHFTEFEKYLNLGIIEAKHRAPLRLGLTERLDELEGALKHHCDQGLIKLGRLFIPDFDFEAAKRLVQRRNSLFHGAPYTTLRLPAGCAVESTKREVLNVNLEFRHGEHVQINEAELAEMANKAIDFSERLQLILGHLAFAKMGVGKRPLTIATPSISDLDEAGPNE